MKTGASVGAILSGYISQIVGRRRTIIISVILSGLLIPAWILPAGEGQLSASGFFIQLLIQGSWGVVPIHLNELSPAAFRSTFPGKQCRIHPSLEAARNLYPTGVTYQIGNMISSPSAQIVNAIAESRLITNARGHRVPAYGHTMAVATAIIIVGVVITAALGPEKRGRHFELEPTAIVVAEEPIKDAEDGQLNDQDKKQREVHVDEVETKQ